MSLSTISYLVSACTLVGTIANAYQRRWGFLVWICTNSFWIIYNLINKEYSQVIVYAINLVVSIIGWFKWKTPKSTSPLKKED